MGVRPDQAGPGSRGLVTRMRAGVADAVRAGGQLRGLTPAALVSFLTAAAFAPLLVPLVGSAGGGEVAAVLSQVGGVGGGYLAGVLSDVLRRAGRAGPAGTGPPTAELIRAELAAAIRQALEAPGGTGTSLRGEVSTVLQKVDAVQAALAADQDNVLAAGLAALGEQVADFRWVLGDVAPRLAEVQRMLAAQGASQRSHMLAARGELDVITGLLQRVVAAQEAQPQTAGTPGEPGTADGRRDVCPYPGLRPFEGRDARWFFGREDLTAHVIGRLAEQLGSGAPLLVIGPSGAGKSSLLRAGVIPGLRDGLLPVPGSRRWPRVLVSRPGSRPLAALAAAARRSGAPQGALRAALDTEPGAGAAALAGHLLDGRKADRLAFSPGGRVLAAVSQDSVVRLWWVPGLQPDADLTPPASAFTAYDTPPVVNAVAFSPRGQTLVSASDDGTAQMWDLSAADEVASLCGALREPGLAAQWQQLGPGPGPDPCPAGP